MLPWPLSLLAHQMRKENEMMEKEGNIVVSSFACLSITACLLMLVAHLVGDTCRAESQCRERLGQVAHRAAVNELAEDFEEMGHLRHLGH